MSLLAIAWKSIRERGLASALTALSVALGVMLMVLVLVISGAVNSAFSQKSIAYHLIVGPKGSGLQLVLSAVYRMQPAIENLPYLYYKELQEDRRVESAVPMAFGDVTEEGFFPLVGTTAEYFKNDYTPGKKFRIGKGGKRINDDFDAIIGSEVARQNQWMIGSQFKIQHGGADGTHVHNEKFTVVAVIQQTGTPNDRTVFVNIEGFYAIAGHETPLVEVEERLTDFYASDPERLKFALDQISVAKAEAEAAAAQGGHYHGATPDAAKEVTAILIRTRSDFDSISLHSDLKEGYQAMAVNPIVPIQKLMNNVLGNVKKGLMVLTGMIILVSGISIFVSIYNSMSDRRREIGIMRALGARRGSVFGIVLAESIVLCVGGGLTGWLFGHGLSVVAAPYVTAATGLLLNPWAVDPLEFVLFPLLLALAALVGFLPAMSAYRTDVADALSN